jgi:hypothetical protein
MLYKWDSMVETWDKYDRYWGIFLKYLRSKQSGEGSRVGKLA